jgi:cytochrome c553
MKTTIVSTFEPNRCGGGFAEMDSPDLRPRHVLATVVAITIFLGSALSLGFGQAANNDAAATYKTNCASCHGADGHGSAVGKSLHAADFHSSQVQDQTDAQLAAVISQGRGNMPPFGTSLSKDQIDALVKYIRTFRDAK